MPDAKTKLEWVKALGPVIISVVSLVSAVTVGILQSYNASEKDVSTVVEQLNKEIIPKIQEAIVELRERNAKLEGQLELLRKLSVVEYPAPPVKEKTAKPAAPKDFKLPQLMVQQVAPH